MARLWLIKGCQGLASLCPPDFHIAKATVPLIHRMALLRGPHLDPLLSALPPFLSNVSSCPNGSSLVLKKQLFSLNLPFLCAPYLKVSTAYGPFLYGCPTSNTNTCWTKIIIFPDHPDISISDNISITLWALSFQVVWLFLLPYSIRTSHAVNSESLPSPRSSSSFPHPSSSSAWSPTQISIIDSNWEHLRKWVPGPPSSQLLGVSVSKPRRLQKHPHPLNDVQTLHCTILAPAPQPWNIANLSF